MKIALPSIEGKLNTHFGHSPYFTIVEVNQEEKKIIKQEQIQAPPHQPGLLPKWLKEKGVNMILANKIGENANKIFKALNVETITGIYPDKIEKIIEDFLNGCLKKGEVKCHH